MKLSDNFRYIERNYGCDEFSGIYSLSIIIGLYENTKKEDVRLKLFSCNSNSFLQFQMVNIYVNCSNFRLYIGTLICPLCVQQVVNKAYLLKTILPQC